MARQFAQQVLNVVMDNVPALYILAYYDDFVQGRDGSLRSFFRKSENIMLEYDEVDELMQLFLADPLHLLDFEEEVIRIVALNLQDDKDSAKLSAFIDKLCPYLISKRNTMSFLTDELAGMYQELAEHCDIPKTCFALLTSIQTNRDSPYAGNSFFLKRKTEYFLEHYVVPVGEIIRAMRQSPYRDKFLSAYKLRLQKYRSDAHLSL